MQGWKVDRKRQEDECDWGAWCEINQESIKCERKKKKEKKQRYYIDSFLLDILHFIGYFIYLHLRYFHLSQFPLQNSLSHPLFPLLLWGCSLTHPLLPHHPSIPLAWGIKTSQDWAHPPPRHFDKAILCFICSCSHESLNVYSLVGDLVAGRSIFTALKLTFEV